MAIPMMASILAHADELASPRPVGVVAAPSTVPRKLNLGLPASDPSAAPSSGDDGNPMLKSTKRPGGPRGKKGAVELRGGQYHGNGKAAVKGSVLDF